MLTKTPSRLTITDHARVRYLERVCGVDVAQVDREIAALVKSDATPRAADALGGTVCATAASGVRVVIAPVTVKPPRRFAKRCAFPAAAPRMKVAE